MKTKTLLLFFTIFFSICAKAQDISESGTLGVGVNYSFPVYGISAKYNFTETHTAQVILGGSSYSFGTNGLNLSGRYIYNFKVPESDFIFRPYVYGQLGYASVRIFNNERFNSVSYGTGGGIEFTFEDFIDGLYFNAELGFFSVNFNNILAGSVSGLAWGGGIHYRFDI